MNFGDMKRKKTLFLLILFAICICGIFYFSANRSSVQQRVVLLIDDNTKVHCTEIVIEDCRDDYVDYCKETGTILYINTENKIVEKNISGGERTIDIEGIEPAAELSNVQYGPAGGEIYFIYEGEIYQYSSNDKTLTMKTDGIESNWMNTYLWNDSVCGYKLMDNGKYNELYYIDVSKDLEQKVCTRWIRSIGQRQGNKIYVFETYANAQHDSSLVDLRDRIIEIDLSDGSIETIQELGSWTENNYRLACNEETLFYIQIKGKKQCLYRMNLATGEKKKVYSTRNKVIGLAVN